MQHNRIRSMDHARTDWLDRWAGYTPDTTAIVWRPENRDYSYAEADRVTGRLVRRLVDDWGVEPGDRVGILATNTLEHVFLLFAAQRLGFILVPMNFRLAAPEIDHLLDDCEPVVVFHDEEREPALLDAIKSRATRTASLGSLLLGLPEASWKGPGPAMEDPAMILYTSGTTGAPKGAVITHAMLMWNAINTTYRLDLSGRDKTMNAAPLYHTGAWNVLATPLWHRGGTVILLERFDPEEILELCETERLTILWGVPTMMRMLAEEPGFEGADLSSVRYALVGGEPMPVDLIELWQDRGVPIRQGFGMTEVGPNCFSLPEAEAIRKIGSIGTPNFYIEVQLVAENGEVVPPDEPGDGELWMRGPNVTPGYWNRPAASAEAITEDGWFRTGDLLHRDRDGYYFVKGRLKEMFISGGENVYPAEVEAALRRHEAVEDASVVGVPDARWGESGAAFVVTREGASLDADEVREFARTQLAKFKVPRDVHFLEELPTNASGKIDRLALTERASTSAAGR